MEYIKLKNKKDIIQLGFQDEEGNITKDENNKEIYIQFDLGDIDLPLKYNKCINLIEQARSNLKAQMIIINKKEDHKGKQLLSSNEVLKVKAFKQCYKEMEEANICYVSIEDFDKFDIESYGKKMVVYDKKENYDKITKFLNDNEIEYINPNTIDESYTYLKTIPIYIIIIILNIILVITYNFMKKSINNSSKTVGILKAYGESEDNVKRYYIIYQLVIMLISIITSIIMFIGLYYYIQPYLTESIFYNLYVHVPIMYFIIFISIMIIYTYIVISHIINKTNKKDIYDLLK